MAREREEKDAPDDRIGLRVFIAALLGAMLVMLLSGCRTMGHGRGAHEIAPPPMRLPAAAHRMLPRLGTSDPVRLIRLPRARIPADTLLLPVDDLAHHIALVQATPVDTGAASYYGSRFAGRRTASGERFDPEALTAAHRTLPFGTRVRVTNVENGRSIIVRINDRGPAIRRRVIDLSRRAAREIEMIQAGLATVELALLPDEAAIRARLRNQATTRDSTSLSSRTATPDSIHALIENL